MLPQNQQIELFMNIDSEIIKEQESWHSKSMQGCLYAAYISKKKPKESLLNRVCFNQPIDEKLILKIEDLIYKSIIDIENNILSIILPAIVTFSDFKCFLNLIELRTNWLIETEIYKETTLKKIRISIGENDSVSIYSWLLGFGPFDFFPYTRQSPYFEIMIPTKSKEELMIRYNRISPTKQNKETIDRGGTIYEAHLADIFIPNITDNSEKDNRMWNGSSKRKKKLLSKNNFENYDDTNAKAKISFSYPVNYEK